MYRLVLSLVLLSVDASAAGPVDIEIGSTTLSVPVPSGFVQVVPEMTQVYLYGKALVTPHNVEFMSFIPEDVAGQALAGELPQLDRRISIQTVRGVMNHTVTAKDFAELVELMKTQNDKVQRKVEAQLPDVMKGVNKNLADSNATDAALSISSIVPLPVHWETERAFAYSQFVRYSMKDESGQPVDFVGTSTATFLWLRGKYLFLFTFGQEDDLEWTRDAARDWSVEAIAMNPSDFEAMQETRVRVHFPLGAFWVVQP